MAYCDNNNLTDAIGGDRLIGLTDDERTGAIVQSRITEATAKADGLIDSYCRDRYAVPFSPVPATIRDASVTLTVYHLFLRRQGVPDYWETKVDDVKGWLKDVARGNASVETPTPDTQTNDDSVKVVRRNPVFTMESMSGF